jgi:hypothetical protein
VARHGGPRAGRWPVQLRYRIGLTSTEYVSRQAWRGARLERCPLHPGGGCSFARHGTYQRVEPAGTRVPRWYCRQGHCTFSLLADCFAARLPGTLIEVEAVVTVAEQAGSREAAAEVVRPDTELPGALRWMRRRLQAVYAALHLLLGLMPDRFLGCQPTLAGFRTCLGVEVVLLALREVAAVHLAVLPAPLGFQPRPLHGADRQGRFQQPVGPDPPPLGA